MAILHKIRDPGNGSKRDHAFTWTSTQLRAAGLDVIPDKLDDARAWGMANPQEELAAVTVGPPVADIVFNGRQGIDAWGDFLLDGEVAGLLDEFPLNEYPGNAIEMVGEGIKGTVSAVDDTPGNSPLYWTGEGLEGLGELISDPYQFFESGVEEGGTLHIGPFDVELPGYDVSDVGGYDTEYFDGPLFEGWFDYEPADQAGQAPGTQTPEATETATPAETTTEPGNGGETPSDLDYSSDSAPFDSYSESQFEDDLAAISSESDPLTKQDFLESYQGVQEVSDGEYKMVLEGYELDLDHLDQEERSYLEDLTAEEAYDLFEETAAVESKK